MPHNLQSIQLLLFSFFILFFLFFSQLFDHEQHRFRDSIYGNLEEQASYPPGPGAYDIRAKTAPILNNTNAKNPSALVRF